MVELEPVPHLALQDEFTSEITGQHAVIPSGIFTISGPFGHRTFSVERQDEKANFCPGKRIVYLLVGRDNEHDWKAFGFVHDGAVRWPISVYQKLRGEPGDRSVYEEYAERLTHMICGGFRRFSGPDGQVHTYKLLLSRRCFRCDQRLTDPESIRTGLGPTCRKRGS